MYVPQLYLVQPVLSITSTHAYKHNHVVKTSTGQWLTLPFALLSLDTCTPLLVPVLHLVVIQEAPIIINSKELIINYSHCSH